MDFVFISMPYAKTDSAWFSNVPNINLGVLNALLTGGGKQVKTFHFHLAFLPYIREVDTELEEAFCRLSHQLGVEYLSLDYVFASILFENRYLASKGRFGERLTSVGLTLSDFERTREVANSFVESAYLQVCSFLKEARLVGFTCSHYQLSASLLLCSKIKKDYPHVKTILGGKDCSGGFGYELMSNMDFVDYVGTGECEVTISSLLQHLDDQNQPVHNVLFRHPSGEIKKASPKPNFTMSSLPSPEYDFQDFAIEPDQVILPLELGRGCPWGKCTFCPDESYNIRCQSKTAEQIKAEIKYYQGISKDLKNFIILDSDSLKEPELIIELSQYLRGRNLCFHFAEFRAQRMGRRIIEALLDFGQWVSPFQVGIETFSDGVLGLMKKGVTALKNVEVLKMVAELGIPLQFNLFTCYPNMTNDDLRENVRVMDLISHILVCENIEIFPGEFYLPTDCPIFLNIDKYGLDKAPQSIFADAFEAFPMPSYSNYPYQYMFHNDEKQFNIAGAIREKVAAIKDKGQNENYMRYETNSSDLKITVFRDGEISAYSFQGKKKEIYLAAIEKSQRIDGIGHVFGLGSNSVRTILEEFDEKGLILYSSNRKSFLSLAMKG